MHPLREIIKNKKLLSSIADRYGTPLYVYDKQRIHDNVTTLSSALSKSFDNFHICYAIKSNSNPHLIRVMRESFSDIGGDCSSPGEIYAAELSGIKPSKCIYTGNYESETDLREALNKGCNINLDDLTSLDRLKKINIPERVSFRMNPGFGGGSYSGIITGGRDAKFGIPAEKIIEAYKNAMDLGIKRFGLQCMCGSGNLDEKFFAEVLSAILDNAKRIETELQINFEYISMGGGFGIPYQDEESPIDFDRMFANLSKIYYSTYPDRGSAPSLWLEPGKSIIADAGFIISSVTGLKESYKNFIGIDAGMETLMRPALYGAKHRMYKAGNHGDNEITVDFTGQICENTDRIATDRQFPSLSQGDLIAIMDAGAYGYSMSHNFNTRPRSAEILLDKSSFSEIRKEKQLKIYFHFVNYKRLAFLFILSLGISQQSYKGIHQLELEYNNENFVEPLYKTYSEPADPITQIKKNTSRKVFGYHPYWQGTKWQNYNFELLSTIAYFSAEANENGELVNLHGWPATDLINKAHDNGVEVVLTVTLFSKTKLEILLSSNENRKRLIDNLKFEVERAGADGVNIDFESFPESQRLNLITFVKDLRFSLRSSIPNAQVTLATPAVDWNNAWDFKSLANESDGLFIMGYDYHWKGSTLTGPVAPLTGGSYNVSNTINTYLSITENNLDKIILGVPYYGYSWPSLSGEKGSNTTGTGSAKLFSSAEARALSYGKKWDTLSQTPWYRFQNPDWFQTWYDDSLSLSKKYDFVNAKNLGGIGIWALGYDDGYNELWDALKDKIANKSNPSIPIDYSVESLGGGMLSVNFSNVENATGYEVVEIISGSTQGRTVGKFLKSPILIQGLKDDIPYFYKVRALNQFGFSEFTELLGSTPSPVNSKVLIVNGFDRVAGTANTFDFILEHGNAIYTNGYSFDAASNEAIINEKIKLNDYEIVDWILGEEGAATSAFDEREKILLQDYIIKGGRLFVSGSEIGYDMSEKGNNSDRIFYENILKAEYISDAAGGTSGVYEIEGTPNSLFNGYTFSFDNGENGNYDVDWPDGIKPAGNAVNILKFRDVDYEARGGAGIAYRGTFLNSKIPSGIVYLSIGFESIYPEEVRTDVMKEVLQFLEAPIASVIDDEPIVPGGLSISALYPNPSNQSISIEFKVKELSPIAFLTITDLLGREVFKMSALSLPTKIQRFNWNGLTKDGNKAPSGVYLVYLSQGNKIVNKKFTLLK